MPDTTRDTQRCTGGRIIEALRRTRPFALLIFLAYVLSSAVGIVMAHAGNRVALAARNKTVRKALASDEASIAYQSGNPARAVVFDFAGNLFMAAIPQTVAGLGVALPFISVAYQGWVGGVVSVDCAHRSRLRSIKAASYYFLVLLLQFIPFSLSIGAGVRCGVDLYRHNSDVSWRFWRYRLPRESLVDVARVYAATVPLFFVASAFEFFSPWNA
ncbi:MAG: hypothetical protein HY824_01900 [Acidobacteria bacterium]|nr:hypothetical protein [Acidobacteriota bacterium]